MERGGNQELSGEHALPKDSFGDANRLRRYALSALGEIEKESKRHPQSGHPISYLGEIAGNRNILQFLYDNHQGLALEHDGRRVIYYVIKDPEDPENKRLIIQGLGFNRVHGQTLDIEWLKQYGRPEDKHDIETLAKLTHRDVIRSVRRAMLPGGYDPYKYKNRSVSGAIELGINRAVELSGARAISGTVSDRIDDSRYDRKHRRERDEAAMSPSDRLRRGRRKGIMKEVALTAGGFLAAGAIVGSAAVYDSQHPGAFKEVIGKSVGVAENVGEKIAKGVSGLWNKNPGENPPEQPNSPAVRAGENPPKHLNFPPTMEEVKERTIALGHDAKTLAAAAGVAAGVAAAGIGAEVGRRRFVERRKWRKEREKDKLQALRIKQRNQR